MDTWRIVRRVAAAVAIAGISGCVTGKVLSLPGGLARPGTRTPGKPAAAAPAVAVIDFAFKGSPPHEIGRDFDHARAIVWKGEPGKAMADLVAQVLREAGVPAVRYPAEAEVPPDAVAKVWGSVDRFRVEARKTGALRTKAESSASVAVTVYGSGGSLPDGWNSAVASDTWSAEPFFVTPEGVRDAVNGAANAVAEETARRLIAAGVAPLPAGGTPGGPGEGPSADR